jgi:hypothetical protein
MKCTVCRDEDKAGEGSLKEMPSYLTKIKSIYNLRSLVIPDI